MSFRNLIAIAVILISSGVASAQPPAAAKVCVIYSDEFFNEKAGITKLVNANKQLNVEFAPLQTELETLNKRVQSLKTEMENIRKLPTPDAKLFQTKSDEAEQLQRNIKYKSEDAQERYRKRQIEILGPIQQSIGTSLQEYAKAKGYGLIFDATKDQNGLLVTIVDQSVDVTKDFIAFYNAKP